jgi:hypothetical protein
MMSVRITNGSTIQASAGQLAPRKKKKIKKTELKETERLEGTAIFLEKINHIK